MGGTQLYNEKATTIGTPYVKGTLSLCRHDVSYNHLMSGQLERDDIAFCLTNLKVFGASPCDITSIFKVEIIFFW